MVSHRLALIFGRLFSFRLGVQDRPGGSQSEGEVV